MENSNVCGRDNNNYYLRSRREKTKKNGRWGGGVKRKPKKNLDSQLFCYIHYCWHVNDNRYKYKRNMNIRRGTWRFGGGRCRDGTSFRNIKTRYLRPFSRHGVHLSFKGFSLLLFSRSINYSARVLQVILNYYYYLYIYYFFCFLRWSLSDIRV